MLRASSKEAEDDATLLANPHLHHKAQSLLAAAEAIAGLEEGLPSGKAAAKIISGVGKVTAELIDDIIAGHGEIDPFICCTLPGPC